ncbi:helix-turn-helix domain-containing protein [Numidum massiliense]|uniref:helix-turn-helix domain-containing protein n=1 Tax=Numidum massiliense TaxID=1522315 RepID=UPI0006D547A1|nr:helix-turn-helix domain-containing protein [Numidum massiliense]
MSEHDLFSVDQLAQIVSMHPRTIRRYIREGKLAATKIGGEWRIRREDAEAFIGMKGGELQQHALDEVTSYLTGESSGQAGELTVCSVLDCYGTTEEAKRIADIIITYMNAEDPARGKAKFQYHYDGEAEKGRYILWGKPLFIGKVLSAIGEKEDDHREG